MNKLEQRYILALVSVINSQPWLQPEPQFILKIIM